MTLTVIMYNILRNYILRIILSTLLTFAGKQITNKVDILQKDDDFRSIALITPNGTCIFLPIKYK